MSGRIALIIHIGNPPYMLNHQRAISSRSATRPGAELDIRVFFALELRENSADGLEVVLQLVADVPESADGGFINTAQCSGDHMLRPFPLWFHGVEVSNRVFFRCSVHSVVFLWGIWLN